MARRKRRGVVVVLAAVMMVVMLGMIAFAVDLGMITVARTEQQTAADAAALAGVAKLPLGESAAIAEAELYVGRNTHARSATTTTTRIGQWDAGARVFNVGQTPFDAVQVQVDSKNQALFFGRVLGTNTYNAGASATAIVRPRDIMLVLDFSGSMNEHHMVDQLKESVQLFFDVLGDNANQDRVGFARYSTFGELVMPLSYEYAAVNQEVQNSKANGWTNIGDGMQLSRTEFENNARSNATKMMVIMTSGMANKPENRDPHQYVLSEAELADAEGIDLYTISFGSDADKTLMDDVAEIGNDVYFSVDGGVGQCEQELRAVFLKIATKWKIQLVQ